MKPGVLVSHYRIDAKIGEGGMGEVFDAHDETLKRKVALKTVRITAQLRSDARTRFTREARVLSQLDHPHICRVFDYLSFDEGDMIVLELIEGHALNVDIGKLTYAQQLAIAEDITSALVAAHAAGIVHRDLKPGNIMLTVSGGVKVLDFGLACVRESATVHEPEETNGQLTDIDLAEWSDSDDSISGFHTEVGSVFGTVQFMSPEQASGDPVGPASDMFSLGLVLQELFMGTPARKLKRSDGLARAAAGESNPISGVPRDLAQLITRMKEGAPTRRPTAVEALARMRWIRATPQRRLRRALIAGVAVVGLVGATKYTLDLRAERETSEWNRRRTEAEKAFQLGSLYDQLKPVQQTGILGVVAQRAVSDYSSIAGGALLPDQIVNFAQAWILLGRVRGDDKNLSESRVAFESALNLIDSPAAVAAPASILDRLRRNALIELAEVRKKLGDPALAEQAARSVQDLAHANTGTWDDPLSPSAWEGRALTLLGDLAVSRGDRGEAGEFFTKAQGFFAGIASPTDEELFLAAQVEFWIGNLALELGDVEAATVPLQRYLEISQALSDGDPGNIRWKTEVAYAHSCLGTWRQTRGDVEAARGEFRIVVSSWRSLTYYDASNTTWQMELAGALSWLSTSELSGWHVTQALEPVQEELRIREGLADRDPLNMERLRGRSICENNLGDVLEALGRFEEARVAFSSAVEHSNRLVEAEPTNADWLLDRAVTLMRAGRNLIDLKDHEAAEHHLLQAQQILAAETAPFEARQKAQKLILCQVELASLHLARGEDELARSELGQAEALQTSDAFKDLSSASKADSDSRIRALRAALLERAGDHVGAVREAQTALNALEGTLWKSFTTARAGTYVSATRLVHGEGEVEALLARYSKLGYTPIALGH